MVESEEDGLGWISWFGSTPPGGGDSSTAALLIWFEFSLSFSKRFWVEGDGLRLTEADDEPADETTDVLDLDIHQKVGFDSGALLRLFLVAVYL